VIEKLILNNELIHISSSLREWVTYGFTISHQCAWIIEPVPYIIGLHNSCCCWWQQLQSAYYASSSQSCDLQRSSDKQTNTFTLGLGLMPGSVQSIRPTLCVFTALEWLVAWSGDALTPSTITIDQL